MSEQPCDANFGQRHNFKAGCPPFKYRGVLTLDPAHVSAMEAKLDSHTAGTASKAKVLGEKFDDTGVFALICRHGAPLCFIISDGGEGQKYMLASLEWLSTQLPSTATLASYYDIGCFTDRTRQLYDVLPAGFSDQVVFVTSAMHAYAHQWTCQLFYSPRMKKGIALTDGEGVERLWSALRMPISKLRSVSRRRRIVLLDRQMQRVSRKKHLNLGRLLRKRCKATRKKDELAPKVLASTGYDIDFLEEYIDPTKKLKKSLDAVLQLQEQVDAIEESIPSTEASVTGQSRKTATEVNRCIRKLKASQAELTSEAQALYATLNIDQEFDEIRGLGLQFTAVLLQAFEAKRTCQRLLRRRFQE
ncbi:hypothetical protein AURDEDRAFT_177179 [Auricularia subglabra TFB-10046 SS5]|uniref:Uncharacterized protein n=1 Tax=Auricularia subglabra (strain TFB-10046 / SS5) TaxID=717982 RepID=J0WPE3_AURST|nr:hypothetical protein AURDEDRAFT_177179 [Auricularia subglabra TFB-10046 SS5]